MAKDKELMYKVTIDPYKVAANSNENKKIFIDDKQIALSVGGYLSMDDDLHYALLIDVHYDSKNIKTLTDNIPQLESFKNRIAINPNFKDKRVIKKLRELNIISNTIETVNYKGKDYELVDVNIDELKLYKPFGDSILNDFKTIETVKSKETEL